MVYKREVNQIPYAGYKINSYVLIDENGNFIVPACDFLLSMAIAGSPPNSLKSYASDLISFFSALYSVKNLDSTFPSDFREITEADLDAHLIGSLYQTKKLTSASVLRHSATLNQFYEFAYHHGYSDYFVKWRNKRKLPAKSTMIDKTLSSIGSHYIDREAFESIILPSVVAQSSFKRARDELVLKIGYYAGLRAHEIVMYDNFTLAKMEKLIPKNTKVRLDEHLSVRGKGSIFRRLPLHPKLVSHIHDFIYGVYRSKLKRSLFEDGIGNPLKDEQYASDVFRQAIKNYLSKNNVSSEIIDSLKSKSFHSLRHSYATNAVTFCMDVDTKYNPRWAVTQWMGHANEKTTEIYICFEAVKNNRLGVIDAMKLSDTRYPNGLKNN